MRRLGWIVLLIAFDQVTKMLAQSYFPDVVKFNPGVSFSIYLGDVLQWILIAVALVSAVGFCVYCYRETRSSLAWWATVLIISGGVGNLIDRLRFEGKVLDFIAVPWFAVFNFADIYISMGVGSLIIAMYLHERSAKAKKESL